MRLRQTSVIIGLGPRGVEAVRGHRRAERPLPPGSSHDPRDLDAEALLQATRQVLEEVRAPQGSVAVLVYDAPTTIIDAMRVPASGSAAERAAELAVLDALPPGDAGPSDAVLLAGLSPVRGESLALAAAELGTTAEWLHDWITRCGLRCGGFVPSGAITLAAAASEPAADGPEVAELHVGPESSVVVVRDPAGRIDLIRPLGIGYEHLAEALHAGSAPAPGDAPRMSREHALRILFRSGLPKPDEEVDDGLDGRLVLPALQPVLQRLAVELKQTLRFGLPEGRKAPRRTRLCGPGAGIARLDEFLSNALSADVVAGAAADGEPPTAAQRFAVRRLPLLIRPTAVQDEAASRRLRAAAHVGVGLAAAVLVLEGVSLRHELTQAEEAARRLSERVAAVERRIEIDEAAAALRAEIAEALDATRSSIGEMPDWRGLLAEVGAAAQSAAELTEVSGLTERGVNVLVVRGIADPAGAEQPDPLVGFIDRLRQSPLVADVRLHGKRSDAARLGGAEEFEIRVAPVGLPARVAGAEGGR